MREEQNSRGDLPRILATKKTDGDKSKDGVIFKSLFYVLLSHEIF